MRLGRRRPSSTRHAQHAGHIDGSGRRVLDWAERAGEMERRERSVVSSLRCLQQPAVVSPITSPCSSLAATSRRPNTVVIEAPSV
jgi:hypothetical protein